MERRAYTVAKSTWKRRPFSTTVVTREWFPAKTSSCMVLYSFWIESILFTTVCILGLFLSSTTWIWMKVAFHKLTQIRICNTILHFIFNTVTKNISEIKTFAISLLYGKCSSLKFRCAIWPTVSKAEGIIIPSGSKASKTCNNNIGLIFFYFIHNLKLNEEHERGKTYHKNASRLHTWIQI